MLPIFHGPAPSFATPEGISPLGRNEIMGSHMHGLRSLYRLNGSEIGMVVLVTYHFETPGSISRDFQSGQPERSAAEHPQGIIRKDHQNPRSTTQFCRNFGLSPGFMVLDLAFRRTAVGSFAIAQDDMRK